MPKMKEIDAQFDLQTKVMMEAKEIEKMMLENNKFVMNDMDADEYKLFPANYYGIVRKNNLNKEKKDMNYSMIAKY